MTKQNVGVLVEIDADSVHFDLIDEKTVEWIAHNEEPPQSVLNKAFSKNIGNEYKKLTGRTAADDDFKRFFQIYTKDKEFYEVKDYIDTTTIPNKPNYFSGLVDVLEFADKNNLNITDELNQYLV